MNGTSNGHDGTTRRMIEATRLTRAGRLTEAVETLMAGAGSSRAGRTMRPPWPGGDASSLAGPWAGAVGPWASATRSRAGGPQGGADAAGRIAQGSFTGPAGTREYRVVAPSEPQASGPPLIVMLHGGTQSAEDFAAATGMDELAEREGFVVAYPEQSRSANAMGYWNWFDPRHQGRDGEPSLIAGITRTVTDEYVVDPARVFVAGFSAGAAMAAVMGATHPELFGGVGVHSGLPHGAARDVGSAFAVMRGGPPSAAAAAGAVPIVVVHGDGDRTVAPGNAAHVVASGLRDAGRCAREETRGTVPSGRSWTRERWAAPDGRVRVESWTVHGSGHAWSGGRAGGSYTDPQGPDASAAMVRFFDAGRG